MFSKQVLQTNYYWVVSSIPSGCFIFLALYQNRLRQYIDGSSCAVIVSVQGSLTIVSEVDSHFWPCAKLSLVNCYYYCLRAASVINPHLFHFYSYSIGTFFSFTHLLYTSSEFFNFDLATSLGEGKLYIHHQPLWHARDNILC